MNYFKIFFFATLITPSIVLGQINGNSENGGKLYKKKCVTCHGKQGEGKKSQKAPKLAGQHDWYLYEQLVATQSGKRNNPKMMPFVKGLSDQDLKDLSSYISSAFPWK
jgi:cytochrome c553